MNNLPLFDEPPKISSEFDPSADVIVFNGDTNNLIDVIPDDYVKLIITSPPYNLGKSYEDQVSIDSYLDTQANIIAQLYRILHPEGSICSKDG